MKKRTAAVLAVLMLCQAIWLAGCAAENKADTVAENRESMAAETAVEVNGADIDADTAAEDGERADVDAAAVAVQTPEDGQLSAEKNLSDEGTENGRTSAAGEEASGGRTEDSDPAAYTGAAIPARFQDGVNGFALRFTRQMLEEKGMAENLIVSPFSVWLPLTALANATDEEAMEELLSALGLSDADMAVQNGLTEQMIRSLQQEERREWLRQYGEEMDSPLKIANAVFVGKDMKLQKAFKSVFTDVYQGRIFRVDFADDGAVEQVNAWASEQTDGEIQDLISHFEPETVAALANAVYFSDGWSEEFSEELTKDDLFCGADGEETVPFMNGEFDSIPYYAGDGFEMASLPTQNGGRLMLLLPAEEGEAAESLPGGEATSGDGTAEKPGPGRSAEEVLAGLDPPELNRLLDADRTAVHLSLPRFRLESDTFSVLETLEAMGVPLSDDRNPHIDGLANRPLYLSQAVQKAMLEADEKGLTAAAVTALMMAEGALMDPPEPVELKFDRPFAFLLTADGGDAGPVVLFSGVVNRIE